MAFGRGSEILLVTQRSFVHNALQFSLIKFYYNCCMLTIGCFWYKDLLNKTSAASLVCLFALHEICFFVEGTMSIEYFAMISFTRQMSRI